jgi:polysaccharide export outer membrane protein
VEAGVSNQGETGRGSRSLPTLLELMLCAALLAGCGASLQNELATGVGSSQVGSIATVNGAAAVSAAPVATASTGDTAVAVRPGDTEHAGRPPYHSAAGAPVASSSVPVVQKAALSGQRDALVEAPATAVARLPPAAANLTAVAEPGHVAYRIGPLDVLTVTVFRVPELSAEVQVADTGTINLPLIGDIQAAGRTAKDVEKEVTAKLGEKYLQNPQVTVFIKEYNAQRVTVNGAVKKPGVFPLKGRTTLLQLISMAEGLDHNRASSNVVVFRNSNGKRTAARFDLDQIHDGTAEDPTLQPGDIVVVDDSSAKILWQNLLRALPITNVFTAVL